MVALNRHLDLSELKTVWEEKVEHLPRGEPERVVMLCTGQGGCRLMSRRQERTRLGWAGRRKRCGRENWVHVPALASAESLRDMGEPFLPAVQRWHM